MSDYTYRISADGTAGTANAGFTTFALALADFAANNHTGATGNGKIAANSTLYFKISGNYDLGSAGQEVAGIVLDHATTSQIIVEAYSNPWNSATRAIGQSSAAGGYDGLTFGQASLVLAQAGWTVRNLVFQGTTSGYGGLLEGYGTVSSPAVIENVLIYQTGTTGNGCGFASIGGYVTVRNTAIVMSSTATSGQFGALMGNGAAPVTFENCVIACSGGAPAGSQGINSNDGSHVVKNTYVGGFAANYAASFNTGACVGNSSAGTDTPENNTALESIAFSTTNFENVTDGSEDLRVKSTSVLKTTGAARLASVLTDVFGVSRSSVTTVGANAAEAAVVTPPAITTQPTAQSVTAPNLATFSLAATGTGLTYQWQQNPGGNTAWANPVAGGAGETTNTYVTAPSSVINGPQNSGDTFRCLVTNAGGTTTSNAVALTVTAGSTTVRPRSDLTVTGWTSTGAKYYTEIDEATASSTDYITSPVVTATPAPITIGLDQPVAAGSRTLNAQLSTTVGTATARVRLLNDSNVSMGVTADVVGVTTTPTTYVLPITLTGTATRAQVEFVL